jgi:hypothetical protein
MTTIEARQVECLKRARVAGGRHGMLLPAGVPAKLVIGCRYADRVATVPRWWVVATAIRSLCPNHVIGWWIGSERAILESWTAGLQEQSANFASDADIEERTQRLEVAALEQRVPPP